MNRLLPTFTILLCLLTGGKAQALSYIETPSLAADVAAGKLPPVEQRIPSDPAIETGRPGQPGGELHVLISSARETRLLAIIGYARLMAYTPSYDLVPDMLESVDQKDERVFTLHLRPGHRWSDGEPFTAEDFRYWWDDVANNQQLAPTGPPVALLREGEKPKVEILDPLTVRYSWSQPMPTFLALLASPTPITIYRPAHYLKQFHVKYADKDKLAALVAAGHARNWAQLHNRMDNPIRNDNPDLPTLDPWVLKTAPPSERFVFERNPYYYRVDREGRQLPYIDRINAAVADSKIIPVKVGAGEVDLQSRYLRFDNYTFLKAGEARNSYRVRLWKTGYGSQLTLYPNLNVTDPVWRTLLRDVRFRRALSLAIDRHEINNVIYYGLALEGQNTMLPGSPLYDEADRKAWAQYDPAQAGKLLDEIGLTKRNGEGIRLLPDGRPLQIVVETAGTVAEESDVLELIRDTWREVGIKLFSKPLQIELMHNRIFSGETMMSIDRGLENGLANAEMSPAALAPTLQNDWQWPRWGQYYETHGMSGEAPDMPMATELMQLGHQWMNATDFEARRSLWRRMLAIHADRVLTIGLCAEVPQPVVVSDRLRNVPEQGIYNFDPGAFFGVYKPDRFWFVPEVPADQPS
ncbi:MAG TPA: ABC transporter substrate-binding protein [Aliidongia sp.]|uniref:ABC transporter substrate-binding protein n=1 Tax=Aliidongia sp. TaxID=1914230 RepID=UPI002DDD6B3F|nr:ABC transporter substrate-binding protein [Aliidongia sp.]HEV2677723.1 ABC transporter substrate-binding protein [Aliidongia sp.]